MNKSPKSNYSRPSIPDGDYVVRLIDIERGHTKAEAKPFVKFPFEIVEGPHKGKCDEKTSMLSTDKAKAQFSAELKKLGFTVSNGSEFLAVVDELMAAHLCVNVKNLDDGNRLIYFAGLAKAVANGPGTWDF